MSTDDYCEDCGGEYDRTGPYACVCDDEPGYCCTDGTCTDCMLNAGLDPDCF
jgi:hypothetical protein